MRTCIVIRRISVCSVDSSCMYIDGQISLFALWTPLGLYIIIVHVGSDVRLRGQVW